MEPEWQGPLRPDPAEPVTRPASAEGSAEDRETPAPVEYQVDDAVGTPIEDTSSGRIKIAPLPRLPMSGVSVQLNIPVRAAPLPTLAPRRDLKREADIYGLARSLQLLSVYVLLIGLVGMARLRGGRGLRFTAEDCVPLGILLLVVVFLFEMGRRLRRLSEGARWLTLFLNFCQILLAIGQCLSLQIPAVVAALILAGLSALNIWVLLRNTELAMFGRPYRAMVAESDVPVSAAASVVGWANVLFLTGAACFILAVLTLPI